MEICNAACQRDQAAVQECSKKLEVCPGLFDSTVKQVEGTETAGFENYKEISMQRNAEVALVEVAGDLVIMFLSLSLSHSCLLFVH